MIIAKCFGKLVIVEDVWETSPGRRVALCRPLDGSKTTLYTMGGPCPSDTFAAAVKWLTEARIVEDECTCREDSGTCCAACTEYIRNKSGDELPY